MSAEREAHARHELPVEREALRLRVGDAHGARVQPQVNQVRERVLGAHAAVELEVGVLLDRVVRGAAVGRRHPQDAGAREHERRQLTVGDLARHDVVDQLSAWADDDGALAVLAIGRGDADAFDLDAEHRMRKQAEAQRAQRRVLRAGQRRVVSDADLDVVGEDVRAARDAHLELDPLAFTLLRQRALSACNQPDADESHHRGDRSPPEGL